MRIQAIRASETLYKAGDKSFAADYKRLTQDASPDVVIQAMLTMNKWKVPDANATIAATAEANKARGVQLVATAALNPAAATAGRGGRGAGPVYTPEQQGVIDKGGQIYKELCFACHGDDGLGATRPGDTSGVTMAPRLAGSPRVNGHRDYVIKAVLHGLTGAGRRADLLRRDDPDGQQPGRVDRLGRVVRPHQLRQRGRTRERG